MKARVSSRARTAIGVAVASLAIAAAAGCDTDDGTTLRPPPPGATAPNAGTTAPPTEPTDALEMLPGDDAALNSVQIPTEPPDPLSTAEPGAPGTDDADTVVPTDDDGRNEADGGTTFSLVGPWLDGAPIDARYTCDGADVSPALSWLDPPAGTVELAFAMVDDSTSPPGSDTPPFVHWVLAGVDPAEISLVEGATPPGAVVGLNFFGDVDYGGPCPPVDDPPHDYRIVAYALNQQSELADGTPATDFINFIEAVAIETTELTGTYDR